MSSSPDWDTLLTAAAAASVNASAPYSDYPVGAAAFVDDGRIVSGCNVENASFGLTLCAECGMVSELMATGGGQLTAAVCVNREGAVIMPCGR
ncbi:MAG: cytidine deaminase, partial [Ornithinimicrobium sp.]|uniref:cytidine deaminase n=1 Tax=Ornithinimicrobium sp. TaxID=1977084 RepID=UPI003D9AB69D